MTINNSMGKILALDYGEVRIGYAVSDESAGIAFPRASLAAKPQAKFLEQFRKILREEKITKIVIGVPLGEDNEETRVSKRARALGQALAREFILPVEYIDEFGSSAEALQKIPFRKDRREKGISDAIAAQIILQMYLDEK